MTNGYFRDGGSGPLDTPIVFLPTPAPQLLEPVFPPFGLDASCIPGPGRVTGAAFLSEPSESWGSFLQGSPDKGEFPVFFGLFYVAGGSLPVAMSRLQKREKSWRLKALTEFKQKLLG